MTPYRDSASQRCGLHRSNRTTFTPSCSKMRTGRAGPLSFRIHGASFRLSAACCQPIAGTDSIRCQGKPAYGGFPA